MFDPSSLKLFCVIRIHFEYKNQDPGLKRFVVLWHQEAFGKKVVVCAKATSNVDRYLSDTKLFDGCVYYPAKELEVFSENTVIQPDNALALPYEAIIQEEKKGRFEILGNLPHDFEEEFLRAVEASITLMPKAKKVFVDKLKKRS